MQAMIESMLEVVQAMQEHSKEIRAWAEERKMKSRTKLPIKEQNNEETKDGTSDGDSAEGNDKVKDGTNQNSDYELIEDNIIEHDDMLFKDNANHVSLLRDELALPNEELLSEQKYWTTNHYYNEEIDNQESKVNANSSLASTTETSDEMAMEIDLILPAIEASELEDQYQDEYSIPKHEINHIVFKGDEVVCAVNKNEKTYYIKNNHSMGTNKTNGGNDTEEDKLHGCELSILTKSISSFGKKELSVLNPISTSPHVPKRKHLKRDKGQKDQTQYNSHYLSHDPYNGLQFKNNDTQNDEQNINDKYEISRFNIFDARKRKLRNRSIREYLVRWKNLPIKNATWEGAVILQHPNMQLLVVKQFEEGRSVISPLNRSISSTQTKRSRTKSQPVIKTQQQPSILPNAATAGARSYFFIE